MPTPASCGRQPVYASEAYLALSDLALSDRARAGDEAAAWALTARVEGVIQNAVAQELCDQPRPACLDEEDLLSYARMEVQKAMRTWEAGDGFTFHLQAYAATVTRRSVQARLAANALIPLNHRTRQRALKIGEQARQFEDEHGRAPEPSELQARQFEEEYGRAPEPSEQADPAAREQVRKIERALTWLNPAVSLPELCGSDGERRSRTHEPADPGDSPDLALEEKDIREVALQGFSELPTRQRLIIANACGLDGRPPLTKAESRRELKISKHQFKKEYCQAIATLRALVKG